MKCPHCSRRFRSPQAYKLYLKRQAVIADLKLTARITYSTTPADKIERHREQSQDYRQHG